MKYFEEAFKQFSKLETFLSNFRQFFTKFRQMGAFIQFRQLKLSEKNEMYYSKYFFNNLENLELI